jgi:catechol 2,3-dioxygenase
MQQVATDVQLDTPLAANGFAARIGRSGLAVRDLDRVARFYCDVIGLVPIEHDAERVLLGAGDVGFLELVHRPHARPDDPSSAGLFHHAFLLPSRHDLARWLRHATARGQALDGASDHLVSEAIYLSDPEGNGIEVYADRPPDAWRWQDGRIQMATIRLDLPSLLASLDEAAVPWRSAPEGTRIGHVHLRVGDTETAERFYTASLGLAVTTHYPEATFLSWSGYHHHIAANTWRSAGAGPRDPDMAGLLAITLEGSDGTAMSLSDPWGTALRIEPRSRP